MPPAVELVEEEVRELVRRAGLDPMVERGALRELVEAAVEDYELRSLQGVLPRLTDPAAAIRSVMDAVAGFGPLQAYLDDPQIEEIWINGPRQVFVARGGIAELTTTLLTDETVRDLVERMLKSSGRRVDLSSPFVDATLADAVGIIVARGPSIVSRAGLAYGATVDDSTKITAKIAQLAAVGIIARDGV